jgi:hypothetical protein
VFKDTPFNSFTGLRRSRVSLSVHGCYTHSDILSVVADSPEGGIDTAKVSLGEEIMDQNKAQWHALHQELFTDQLVSFAYQHRFGLKSYGHCSAWSFSSLRHLML